MNDDCKEIKYEVELKTAFSKKFNWKLIVRCSTDGEFLGKILFQVCGQDIIVDD